MHILEGKRKGGMYMKVVLDPGHGGRDAGAVYNKRMEKDDNLRLALAVGKLLADNGTDVTYTRTEDVYFTPYERVNMANNADADLFVSLHRGSSPAEIPMNGVESFAFYENGEGAQTAAEINAELEAVGFRNLGVTARPNLIVLKRTKMPAVMTEVGFITSDADNQIFDNQFDEVVQAVADGIMSEERKEEPQGRGSLYRVQIGAFRNQNLAEQLLEQAANEGFPAFLIFEDGFYRVQVGAFRELANAVRMEHTLRRKGYNTYIAT